MLDIIRDSTIGQIINLVSDGKYLPFEDQKPGFHLRMPHQPISEPKDGLASRDSFSTRVPSRASTAASPKELEAGGIPVKQTIEENPGIDEDAATALARKTAQLVATMPPEFLVDWWDANDPENPRNWSLFKRNFVTFCMCLLTFTIYIGPGIYTASIPGLEKEFGASLVVATLGLSLYVLGYGLSPMILSPLQELGSMGRNPIYMITLFLFVIVQIPTALANNMQTVLGLRFFAGLMAGPALSTGGATLSDIYPQHKLAYTIGLWAMAAVCGPVIGPTIGGFAAQAESWRWPIWEMLWISGFSFAFLVLLMPETLSDAVLLRRARRLRKLTGDDRYKSMSEIKESLLTKKDIAKEALIRPFVLMLEPAVIFLNLYVALAYAIFYLWFEAFPIVFIENRHFNLGVAGLPYIGLIVGVCCAYAFYATLYHYAVEPKMMREGPPPNEDFLRLSLITGFCIPISLFIFGWTGRDPSINWIVPTIGAALYMPGIYILIQCALTYLPVSYPRYAASILAGNNFFRATFSAGFPLFGKPFFKKLGLGGGSSLLAGVSLLMLPFLWLLIHNGAELRKRSKYTA